MSYPNGGQPGDQGQWGQPQGGQQGQWGQPQTGGHAAQPQGQWGQPQTGQQTWGQSAASGFNNAKSGSGFDVKNIPWWQWLILGGWLVYFIGLFLPHLTASADGSSPYGGSFSESANGWHYGLHVFAFIILTLAVAAIVASWFMGAQLSGLGFPFGFVTGGLAALGALLGLIGFIVNLTDGDSGYGIEIGPGFGTWITLLALLAIAAGAVMEIMGALKAPKSGGNANAQWGQPAGQGQWGAPATGGQPAVQQGQWGQPHTGGHAAQPQTGGHAAQPQGQWGQPQTGGHPAQPQQDQWGQNPQQGQQGQWGQQG